jgi:8-oxo-dGTP pyrophosphatase MutT (NUDIX family)
MSKVIQAAGGLLWRESDAGKLIALIHRPRYNDWALPKGKLEKGEEWEIAALREIEEETGCKAQLGSFAGAVSYNVGDRPKVVLFWNMVAVGDCKFEPSEEVDQLIWVSVEKALEILQYPSDKDILRSSADSDN